MFVPKMMEGVQIGNLFLLLNNLYGSREEHRIWYDIFPKDVKDIGLDPIPSAPCVIFGNGFLVIFYVDDLLLMAQNE